MIIPNDNNRYKNMKYNRCGRSGLLLPAVSLGLWHNFGSADSFDNMVEMVETAFNLGITHFDLANNYGPVPGSAEENFGKILKTVLKDCRNEIVVSTKAGYKHWNGPYGDWGSRKYLLSSLDSSLKRLGLEYVDIFYSHRPDPDTPLEETMGALATAVKQGMALYAGISNYGPEQTETASKILKNLGVPCLIHQMKYNMFTRNLENGLIDVLEKEGIGKIAFSPLDQGILTDRYLHGIPKGSRADKGIGFLKPDRITGEIISKVKRLNEIAKARGQSMAQMALAWALKAGRLTSVLIGASSPKQIADNVKALDNSDFSDDKMALIDSILGDE
ncbi:MAG: L-glyceraldehyde 3-phosphate reductase [Firmicutes bacterium ADurb.Bin193]|nr:MAG: L-glyceraldehyde 3-phosphate reductase [Firmicutes bacterium ADurb.Bin193]